MVKPGPLSGQTLGGKYLLGELLGKGGFGAVYKAENQLLHRPQAIKVLLEEHFSDEKFRDRFIREARTLAALDHANIVHVDDIGIEGHLIYLVMPYISGGTLQDIMKARSGSLSLEQITRYLEQICSALGYAHAQGIAHLDLKPLNLLVHHDGRLLLSDFGLAHLMEQGAIEGGTSLQFGSPLYMAPEHFDGRPIQQSDIYALGVILYQMLTGRHPFEASTPAAMMRKHLTEPPPSLQFARPDVPVALDAVIGKALAKQPEQRYGRAGELLFDFRAALGGQVLRFANSSDATRISHVYLDPTLRATNPPVSSAGPTLAGRGSAALPPISQPIPPPLSPSGFLSPGVSRPISAPVFAPAAPAQPKIWTQGFTSLFVALAIAGGVVTLVVYNLIGGDSINNFVSIDWMTLLVLGVVASTCLVGLRFVRSKLLRAGLLLQVGSLASNLVLFALILHLDTSDYDPNFPYRWTEVYLPLILTVLNAASLVILSYGMARWQGAQDAKFIVLQLIVSGVVGFLLFGIIPYHFFFSFLAENFGVPPWCSYLVMAVALFAACVFLLRPACWKQQRAVTMLLGLGAVLFVFQVPGGFYVVRRWLDWLPNYWDIGFCVFLLSWLLLLLGFLLLIQTERVRQQAQKKQALAGQRP